MLFCLNINYLPKMWRISGRTDDPLRARQVLSQLRLTPGSVVSVQKFGGTR